MSAFKYARAVRRLSTAPPAISVWSRASPTTLAVEQIQHFSEFREAEVACPRGSILRGPFPRCSSAYSTATRAVQRISEVSSSIPGELGASMARSAQRRSSAVFESGQDAARSATFAKQVEKYSVPQAPSGSDEFASAAAAADAAEDTLAAVRISLTLTGASPEVTAAAISGGIGACEAALPGGAVQWVRPSSFESDVPRVSAHTPLAIAAARLHGVAAAAAVLGPSPTTSTSTPAALPPVVGRHVHAGLLLGTHIGQCGSAIAKASTDIRSPLDLRGSALSLAVHAVAVSARAAAQRNAAAALVLGAWRASLSAPAADGPMGSWLQDPGSAAGALAAAHTILDEELRAVDDLLSSYEHFHARTQLPPSAQAALVRIASDVAFHRIALLCSLAEISWATALASVDSARSSTSDNGTKKRSRGASALIGLSEEDANSIAPLLQSVRKYAERALALAERVEVAATAADCPGAHAFAGKAASESVHHHAQPHELGWRWSDYGPDPGAGVVRPLRTLAGLHALGGTAILAEGLLTSCLDRHSATFVASAAGGAESGGPQSGGGMGWQLAGLPPLQRAQAGGCLQAYGRLLMQVEKRGAEGARLLAAGDDLVMSAARSLRLLPKDDSDRLPGAPPALGDSHLLLTALGVLHVGSTASGSLMTDLASVVGAVRV